MDKKEIMKEVAKTIRSILDKGGYDSSGRVHLYKDLIIEVAAYGHQDVRDYVKKELSKYPNYIEDEFGAYWKDGRFTTFISII